MTLSEVQNKILAALFASGDPLEAARLAEVLELPVKETCSLAASVGDWLDEQGAAIELRTLGDSYQLCTRVGYGDFVRRVLDLRRNQPLSGAALEVLSVVAYNQPVTRGFIEQVRGVDSSGVVASLVEKGLIEESGRLELPGRPIAFRTTANFLRCFGFSSLSELPRIELDEDPPSEADDSGQLAFDSPSGDSAVPAEPEVLRL